MGALFSNGGAYFIWGCYFPNANIKRGRISHTEALFSNGGVFFIWGHYFFKCKGVYFSYGGIIVKWEARAMPAGKIHADFELLERLGEGRISIVYAARLVCLRQSPGGEPLPYSSLPGLLPEQFCLKLAKAESIRSLARDAWFYEQLAREDGYQGVITPYCFGFFSAPLPNTLRIQAWSEIECIPEKHDGEVMTFKRVKK